MKAANLLIVFLIGFGTGIAFDKLFSTPKVVVETRVEKVVETVVEQPTPELEHYTQIWNLLKDANTGHYAWCSDDALETRETAKYNFFTESNHKSEELKKLLTKPFDAKKWQGIIVVFKDCNSLDPHPALKIVDAAGAHTKYSKHFTFIGDDKVLASLRGAYAARAAD